MKKAPVDPERWSRIRALFRRALDVDPPQRVRFVEEACPDDPSVAAEVLALLQGCDAPSDLLDKTAGELAAELLGDDAGAAAVPDGSLFGAYRIVRRLGQGGMGIVYLAEDTRLGRTVALKTLSPTLTADRDHRERFRREARASAALSHPGIAAVYALEEIDDTLAIAFEYVPGETLRQELERGPLSAERLRRTVVDLARALAAAHDLDIVHRDLKPENVVRGPTGAVKILDFGVARVGTPGGRTVTALTRVGMFVGTPAYASPEQLRGELVDTRTDVFAYGVLAYELAAGVHPFGGGDTATIARILAAEPADLSRLGTEVPGALRRIVARCLRKNAAERYANARELLADLEEGALQALPDGAGTAEARPLTAPGAAARARSPLWWWRAHQIVVGFLYYGALVPLYLTRGAITPPLGNTLFFLAVAAAGVAGNLRLHLGFTSRVYPDQLREQRARSRPWIRGAEVALVGLLALTAGLVHGVDPLGASVLLGLAVGSLIAFAVIEPATARAALGDGG